jgi:hypothetical protein
LVRRPHIDKRLGDVQGTNIGDLPTSELRQTSSS